MGRTQPTHGGRDCEKTALASFEATVKQVGRDAMKAFICKAQGIDLVYIHPEDLRRKALDQKIPRCLPRRDTVLDLTLIGEARCIEHEHRRGGAGRQWTPSSSVVTSSDAGAVYMVPHRRRGNDILHPRPRERLTYAP